MFSKPEVVVAAGGSAIEFCPYTYRHKEGSTVVSLASAYIDYTSKHTAAYNMPSHWHLQQWEVGHQFGHGVDVMQAVHMRRTGSATFKWTCCCGLSGECISVSRPMIRGTETGHNDETMILTLLSAVS